MEKSENRCNFCDKVFSSKGHLHRHQTTVKSCLLKQGKEDSATMECVNCKKVLTVEYYRQHKIKCDQEFEQQSLKDKNTLLEKQNKKLKTDMTILKEEREKEKEKLSLLEKDLIKQKEENEKLKIESVEFQKQVAVLESQISILSQQNEKLYTSSVNVTMKLAEKVTNTTNTTNTNNIMINTTEPLTNEVLRKCAATFKIDNAYNINGITQHFTDSLEDHIKCTDPARNMFKYTNEKDEEITDQNLEIVLPQYLEAVKDRNNFLYKEVFDYFKENNVSLDVQTDYSIFYNALNNIIEKKGQQNKYTEKCKRDIIKECKRRFLQKNKNKEKAITRELTVEEVMMNVIETGGSVYDFVDRFFQYNIDDEETDEQFTYRREMEDLFRQKKREWKKKENEQKVE